MTIDIFPTIAGLIGAELPDHSIDGADIWPLLTGQEGAPQRDYFSRVPSERETGFPDASPNDHRDVNKRVREALLCVPNGQALPGADAGFGTAPEDPGGQQLTVSWARRRGARAPAARELGTSCPVVLVANHGV